MLSAHDAIAATVKDLRDEARVQPTPVDSVVADKIEVHLASQNDSILVLRRLTTGWLYLLRNRRKPCSW